MITHDSQSLDLDDHTPTYEYYFGATFGPSLQLISWNIISISSLSVLIK